LLKEQRNVLEAQSVELKLQLEELETSNEDLLSSALQMGQAQQAAQDALLERDGTAALLDASLSSAPLGFAFVDRSLKYVRVNQQFADFVGLTVHQLIGSNVSELLPESAGIDL
jgi:PAS domain-containing protein